MSRPLHEYFLRRKKPSCIPIVIGHGGGGGVGTGVLWLGWVSGVTGEGGGRALSHESPKSQQYLVTAVLQS
jgi:hypothetical protein